MQRCCWKASLTLPVCFLNNEVNAGWPLKQQSWIKPALLSSAGVSAGTFIMVYITEISVLLTVQISTVHCLPDERYSKDHSLCRSARRGLALQLYPLFLSQGAHRQGSGQLPWPAGVPGWCCWAGFWEVLRFGSKFNLQFFLTPSWKVLLTFPPSDGGKERCILHLFVAPLPL